LYPKSFPCRSGKELLSASEISLRGSRQQPSAPSTNSELIFSSRFKVQTFTSDFAGAFVVSNRHFLAAKMFSWFQAEKRSCVDFSFASFSELDREKRRIKKFLQKKVAQRNRSI
jgi:hypothetical protein